MASIPRRTTARSGGCTFDYGENQLNPLGDRH
jgi:hypothetical protein